MNILSFRLLTLAVSIVVAGTVVAIGDDDAQTLNRVSGYRQWTKVNPEPVKVETPFTIDPALVVS
jgi:hypothetical protein